MKFSVIIPTYNRSNFISKSINSVIRQSYDDWELIIVDDGSTDNTKKVVESFVKKDARIKYLYQENKERSAARNLGIASSSGDWICFLDSDDYFLEGHLESFYQLINLNKIKRGIISSGLLFKEDEELIKKPFLDSNVDNIHKEVWSKFLLPTQVCIDRRSFDFEKFDENLFFWEDTNLWLRILSSVDFFQVKQFTAVQVRHKESSVSEGLQKVKMRNVNNYILAINSLKKSKVERFLNEQDFSFYKDSKLKMYLYQARQNRQIVVACRIWALAVKNKFSKELIFEFPKIFLNKIGIGLHNE